MINSKKLFELDDKIARVENRLNKIRRRLMYVENELFMKLLYTHKIRYENYLKHLKELRDKVLEG